MISLANPRTYAGCENKVGKVAELWARRKNAEHPVFDRSTGRRLQPFDFCALAFERHGFIAKETKSLIQKLARIKAAHYELDESEEIRKWIDRMNPSGKALKINCIDLRCPEKQAPENCSVPDAYDLPL